MTSPHRIAAIQLPSDSPFSKEQLIFRSLRGSEHLGECFEYRVRFTCPPTLDMGPLLGTRMTVRVDPEADSASEFTGVVTELESDSSPGVWAATLRPTLSLLKHTRDTRHFLGKTVPQILEEVFQRYPFEDVQNRLEVAYPPLDYVVQYDESDFDFASRLMQREGIYYFFEHRDGRCIMVLADAPSAHTQEIALVHRPVTDHLGNRHSVTDWKQHESLATNRFVLGGYHPNNPHVATRETSAATSPPVQLEQYLPEHFAEGTPGKRWARILSETATAEHSLAKASTGHRGVRAGTCVRTSEHPQASANAVFLVTQSHIDVRAAAPHSSGDTWVRSTIPPYRCNFRCLDRGTPFRSPLTAAAPLANGPVVAVVVGGPGRTADRDPHGRIWVKFPWDRSDASGTTASCPVPVCQGAAGAKADIVHTPRIGTAVLVGFINGDPERPIVISPVHNERQSLPTQRNQTDGTVVYGETKIEIADRQGGEGVKATMPKLHKTVAGPETHLTKGTLTRHVEQGAEEAFDKDHRQTVGGTSEDTCHRKVGHVKDEHQHTVEGRLSASLGSLVGEVQEVVQIQFEKLVLRGKRLQLLGPKGAGITILPNGHIIIECVGLTIRVKEGFVEEVGGTKKASSKSEAIN